MVRTPRSTNSTPYAAILVQECAASTLPGAINLRPVFGLPPGKQIFRSGNLDNLSAAELNVLHETAGIALFIDLRTKSEHAPQRRSLGAAANCIDWRWNPLGTFAADFRELSRPSPSDYSDYYFDILEKEANAIQILICLIESLGCRDFGFGCTLGKDRTGVVAFLLLSLARVPISIVVKDYCLSETYIRHRADMLSIHWKKRGLSREEYLQRICPRSETMYLFAEKLARHYVDVAGYLAAIGVPNGTVRSMQNLLTD